MPKSYYNEPSKIGKPILKIIQAEGREDCIQTIWHLETYRGWSFNMLNAVKYLWRSGQKDPDYRGDLNKAIEYMQWELNNNSHRNNPTAAARRLQIKKAIERCEKLIKRYENTNQYATE